MKGVVVVSGGMDSVTLLHMLAHMHGPGLMALSFDYGQRHVRELAMAQAQAQAVAAHHRTVFLPLAGLQGSALTDPRVAIPHGGGESESMAATVVPGRNAVMLAAAWAIAAATGAEFVAAGVHAAEQRYLYPDCRPHFIRALETALALGSEGHAHPRLHLETPFLYASKREILRMGVRLGVDYAKTWTCYAGEARACGECGACVKRLAAFAELQIQDPLPYAQQVA